MDKQCKSCGSIMPNDAKFCQVCGGSDFIINNVTPAQPMYNQNQYSQNQYNQNQYNQNQYNQNQYNQNQYNQNQYNQQPPVNQTWQSPVPQIQPKKKNTGLIVGIVVAVIFFLAGIGFVAEKVFQAQGYGDDTVSIDDYSINNGQSDGAANNSSEEKPEKKDYSKGTFDGSVYVNEWADIKFALPEGFYNADSSFYSSYENSTTECGMYYIADDSTGFVYICFEKLPTYPIYNEEEYLDSSMKTLEDVSGLTYNKIADTYSTVNIGGYTYKKAECEFNNGYGDFSNTFYVRKLDNYMVFIAAVGINPESNDALVSNITTVE